MNDATRVFHMRTAFVTGSTGLLGNNLVRLLVSRGVRVRALARSREKAEQQFHALPVEIVTGDMRTMSGFAAALRGADVLFHTAAYFRESYHGGHHWEALYHMNVRGTAELLKRAYDAGIRRVVHTSSNGVLSGPRGVLIDETMRRRETDGNDYYRSKILSDREVDRFLETHDDMWACFVLPGWMFGPGDIGPTLSGQLVLDFLRRRLPGIPPATFSVVDARDVAEAMVAAAAVGRRGERYLAAGRHMTMAEVFRHLEHLSAVKGPVRNAPFPLLYAVAGMNELWARVRGRPVSLSLATVRLMAADRDRTHFDSGKSRRELGIQFRPVDDTFRDVLAWYREHGWLENATTGISGGDVLARAG